MKKLQLFTGGHPNSLDDYEHIQESHIESLNAVIAGLIFPNTKAILTGCVFNGTTLTKGAVFYNNEVFYVDAQSITASVNDVWFVIDETVRNNTNVTYLDTNQRSVHIERKAKLQAGGGDVQYHTLLRLENILYTRLDIANLHYTKTEIDNFFATFRNGYDPIFRVNPTNSHLEWSYASPSHPDASGTAQNPWVDLGLPVQYYFGTGGGLFETRISVPQVLPPQPNQTSFVEFNNKIEDEGNVFNLGRVYTVPIAGVYEFGLDQLELELVNDALPEIHSNTASSTPPTSFAATKTRIEVGIYKNNVKMTTSNGATITNAGDDVATLDVGNHVDRPSDNHPDIAATRIDDAVGQHYAFSSDLRLRFSCLQGDEITVQVKIFDTDPSKDYLGNNLEVAECANVRIAYRLVQGRFYTV